MQTSRFSASLVGDKFYNTGKPCVNGHTSKRWTTTTKCVECDRDRQKRQRDKNPEANRNRVKAWQRANPERHAIKTTNHYRQKNHGVGPEDIVHMFNQQDGLCAICQKPFPKTPNVDHCHTTGIVRGLLCNLCNQGLGLFKDSQESLTRAIAYLRKAA